MASFRLALFFAASFTLSGCTFVELEKSSVTVVDRERADAGLRVEFLSDHDLSRFGFRRVVFELSSIADTPSSGVFQHRADLDSLGEFRKPIIFGLFRRTYYRYSGTVPRDLVRAVIDEGADPEEPILLCRMHLISKPWPEAVFNDFEVTQGEVLEAERRSASERVLP